MHGVEGWAEQRREGEGAAAGVIAGQSNPVDIGIAGIEGLQLDVWHRVDDVRIPHPDHVRGAHVHEQVVHVSPRPDEVGRGGTRGSPREPVAVHLMTETDRHGNVHRTNSLREAADVVVCRAVRDLCQRGLERFPRHERQRTAGPRVAHAGDVVPMAPAGVEQQQVRPLPRPCGEVVHPGHRRRSARQSQAHVVALGAQQRSYVVREDRRLLAGARLLCRSRSGRFRAGRRPGAVWERAARDNCQVRGATRTPIGASRCHDLPGLDEDPSNDRGIEQGRGQQQRHVVGAVGCHRAPDRRRHPYHRDAATPDRDADPEPPR